MNRLVPAPVIVTVVLNTGARKCTKVSSRIALHAPAAGAAATASAGVLHQRKGAGKGYTVVGVAD